MKKAETVFEGKRLNVLTRDDWEFVERKKAKSAVVIAAQTPDGKILFVEQERKPLGARVIELPAGLVGDKDQQESEESTARRELEEETGYTCTSMTQVSRGPSSPGITSEQLTFFVAGGLRRKSDGGGVEGEEITVHEVPLDEVVAWLHEREATGTMIDVKVWAGLYFLGAPRDFQRP
jgi:ADP-ribose pyrophosphatase